VRAALRNVSPIVIRLISVTASAGDLSLHLRAIYLWEWEFRLLDQEPGNDGDVAPVWFCTLDHPRQLALMHALVRFSHIAAQSTFRTSEIYADTLAALEVSPQDYSLASLRYDLSKLRVKGLVERVPHSRRYRLLRNGYSVCLVFLKLFERIYAPLTAGLLSPVSGDRKLQQQKRSQLDRLYQRVIDDLDKLMDAVGLKVA
jgi:hypothetical protein